MKRLQLARWLIATTRPTLPPLLASTAFRLLDHGMGLVLLGWIAYFLTEAAARNPIHHLGAELLSASLIVGGGALVQAGAHYLEQLLGHQVAFRALEMLRSQAFHDLSPQAPAVMVERHSADYLTRLTRDIDRIEVFFAHTFAPAVTAVIIPLGLATWMVNELSAAAGLTYLGVVAIAIFLGPLITGRREQQATATSLHTRVQIAQSVTDTIQGAQAVIGYGGEDDRLQQLRDLSEHHLRPVRQLARLQGIRIGLVRSGQMLAVCAPALVAWRSADPSSVHIGAVLAAAFMSVRSWQLVRAVEGFTGGLKESLAAAERVYRLTHGPVLASGDQHWRAPKDIELRDLCFTYPGASAPVLADVRVRIKAGQWVSITGASGGGKTTLARILARYYDPTGGTLYYGGQPAAQYQLAQLREGVHLLTQDANLFAGTIRTNLQLADPNASETAMWEALDVAGIARQVRQFPKGLDHPIAEGGKGVSGGQRQRLCLARSLLLHPDVLILDEFCSQVEPVLDAQIHAQLRAALPTTTVVEITHRDTYLAASDQVWHVSGGRLQVIENSETEDDANVR